MTFKVGDIVQVVRNTQCACTPPPTRSRIVGFKFSVQDVRVFHKRRECYRCQRPFGKAPWTGLLSPTIVNGPNKTVWRDAADCALARGSRDAPRTPLAEIEVQTDRRLLL